jgi:hypothetical protein
MATNYLSLTNELIRELNEVPLTASSFTNAKGIQQHIKDSVNKAYLDIVLEEPKWPFLSTAISGITNPMYGNVVVDAVVGKRWYLIKEDSADITTDYGDIDWENFLLTTVDVEGETSPYLANNLRFTTIEEWKDYFRLQQNLDEADTANYGVPTRIIRSMDGRSFGLSPIPDKAYKIWFFAFEAPTELVAYSDNIIFPDVFKTVLLARARYYIHQFKENPQAASFALDDYKHGVKLMKLRLMSPTPDYFKDDRVRFI